MSIPSRVLISSNGLVTPIILVDGIVSIPSRVLISSNRKELPMSSENKRCQSLQGFSYLLTQRTDTNDRRTDSVSIPSRVLISSNSFKPVT